MGGYGSGRRHGAYCTDECRALDVRHWQRDGLLTPGRSFGWNWYRREEVRSSIQVRTEVGRVVLNYQYQNQGSERQPMEYPVRLDWTACNYGGARAWFLCPAQGCGRRVALLYIGSGGVFACRQCRRLAYRSQRETDYDRAARQADTIRRRLGWQPGILNGEGWKPKGMHWRTFERLKAKHDGFVGISLAGIAQRIGLMNPGLAGLGLDLDDPSRDG